MSKLLLRRGWQWDGGKKNWSQAYWRWLKGLRFDHRADQWMFDDFLTITAMSIAAELHDVMCFDSPRGLMTYLGLVPASIRPEARSTAGKSPKRATDTSDVFSWKRHGITGIARP